MNVQSLAFRALDRHVIDGRADEPALQTSTGTLSYAQLLHESSSLAAGLRELGLTVGGEIALAVPERRIHVVSVLAIARLGAEPVGAQTDAQFRIVNDPAEVHVAAEIIEYDLVLRAGRADPQASRVHDSADYSARLEREFSDIFETLLSLGTVT